MTDQQKQFAVEDKAKEDGVTGFNVWITLNSDKRIVCGLKDTDTVLHLKKKYAEIIDDFAEDIMLVCGGALLSDDEALEENGI